MEIITSTQNPKIKNLQKLQKHQERAKQGIFIVEGQKEIKMALSAGYLADMFFYFPIGDIKLNIDISGFNSFQITKEIFEKIAYREGSDGLLATFRQKNFKLDDIKLSKNPLIIAIEAVEKPGNLGAILRTADAAKVDAVLVCDPRTDMYNPNVVRSSMGCLFTNQIANCTNDQALEWLKKNNIHAYAAALANDATEYHLCDFKKPSCIVMGTEADGLSDFWMKKCEKKIIIPMLGKSDSLNVSVSTAVIVFEARRQRDFNI